MLEGRSDLAVLWDIRVADDVRSRGVGTRLFSAAAEWAQSRGCSSLKIETQNINVPACGFYARMGCTLGAINRFAYTDLPDEVQLVWYRHLNLGLSRSFSQGSRASAERLIPSDSARI
jgi:GNAT superfamily N-acetyltransferase